MAILAGAKIDAADVIGLPADASAGTSIGSASAGFTIVSANFRAALNGKLVMWVATITSTNAITATAGNIADTACLTLDAALRPSEQQEFVWTGLMVGAGNIDPTTGVVELRTASDSITAGMSIRLGAIYLK